MILIATAHVCALECQNIPSPNTPVACTCWTLDFRLRHKSGSIPGNKDRRGPVTKELENPLTCLP